MDNKMGIIKTQQSGISLRSEPVSIPSTGPSSSERIAALEKALRALVAKEPTYGTDTGIYCVSCDAEQLSFIHSLVHEPDCPWVVAWALLHQP